MSVFTAAPGLKSISAANAYQLLRRLKIYQGLSAHQAGAFSFFMLSSPFSSEYVLNHSHAGLARSHRFCYTLSHGYTKFSGTLQSKNRHLGADAPFLAHGLCGHCSGSGRLFPGQLRALYRIKEYSRSLVASGLFRLQRRTVRAAFLWNQLCRESDSKLLRSAQNHFFCLRQCAAQRHSVCSRGAGHLCTGIVAPHDYQ